MVATTLSSCDNQTLHRMDPSPPPQSQPKNIKAKNESSTRPKQIASSLPDCIISSPRLKSRAAWKDRNTFTVRRFFEFFDCVA
jgi:hypothetical protein